MAKKYGLIIDVTRADGCGSDLLSVVDEMTAIVNQPTDSEIPEGKAPIWVAQKEVEQGQHSKVKMDYIPAVFPIEHDLKPLEVIYDDPTMYMQWGDLDDPNSDVAKFLAANADDITDCTPEGLDYKLLYYKMPKPFITGEVISADGECKNGAKVTLTCKKTGTKKEETTDFLGDFQFLGLVKDGEYTLEIEGVAPMDIKLDEAKDLGTIKIA